MGSFKDLSTEVDEVLAAARARRPQDTDERLVADYLQIIEARITVREAEMADRRRSARRRRGLDHDFGITGTDNYFASAVADLARLRRQAELLRARQNRPNTLI